MIYHNDKLSYVILKNGDTIKKNSFLKDLLILPYSAQSSLHLVRTFEADAF